MADFDLLPKFTMSYFATTKNQNLNQKFILIVFALLALPISCNALFETTADTIVAVSLCILILSVAFCILLATFLMLYMINNTRLFLHNLLTTKIDQGLNLLRWQTYAKFASLGVKLFTCVIGSSFSGISFSKEARGTKEKTFSWIYGALCIAGIACYAFKGTVPKHIKEGIFAFSHMDDAWKFVCKLYAQAADYFKLGHIYGCTCTVCETLMSNEQPFVSPFSRYSHEQRAGACDPTGAPATSLHRPVKYWIIRDPSIEKDVIMTPDQYRQYCHDWPIVLSKLTAQTPIYDDDIPTAKAGVGHPDRLFYDEYVKMIEEYCRNAPIAVREKAKTKPGEGSSTSVSQSKKELDDDDDDYTEDSDGEPLVYITKPDKDVPNVDEKDFGAGVKAQEEEPAKKKVTWKKKNPPKQEEVKVDLTPQGIDEMIFDYSPFRLGMNWLMERFSGRVLHDSRKFVAIDDTKTAKFVATVANNKEKIITVCHTLCLAAFTIVAMKFACKLTKNNIETVRKSYQPKVDLTSESKKFLRTQKGSFNVYNYDSNSFVDVAGTSIALGSVAFTEYINSLPQNVDRIRLNGRTAVGNSVPITVTRMSPEGRKKVFKPTEPKQVVHRCPYCKKSHSNVSKCALKKDDVNELKQAHQDLASGFSPEALLGVKERLNLDRIHSRMFKMVSQSYDFVCNGFLFGNSLITTKHGFENNENPLAFAMASTFPLKLSVKNCKFLEDDLISFKVEHSSSGRVALAIPKQGEQVFLIAYDKHTDSTPRVTNGVINTDGYHTCPSIVGNCGGVLVNLEGAVVGIHNAGSNVVNKAIPMTAGLINIIQQGFQ